MTLLTAGRVSATIVLCAILAHAQQVAAQDSRAEEIARLQAEKATQLRPYEKSPGERGLEIAQQIIIGGSGVYPWLGSIYPGGLLGFGGGYRQLFGDTGAFNVLGGWSIKNYKVARADLRLPVFADRRVAITSHAVWLDAPSVAFYGIGIDSLRDNRTTYEFSPTTAGVAGTVRLADWLFVGGGVDSLTIASGGPLLGFETAPGFGEDVRYTVGRASLGIDWRTSPGYSRRGGLYRVEWSDHRDRGDGRFGFQQTEAEVVQLLPLFRESSVLAFRGLVTTTETGAGETVPIFLLPSLGGGTTLRGYPSWRFRDRHRLLLSAEYRWAAAQVIDMALFADGGKVVGRRSDLGLSGLKTNVGIGIRLHGPSFTALRFDVARGREGWVLNLGGGAAF